MILNIFKAIFGRHTKTPLIAPEDAIITPPPPPYTNIITALRGLEQLHTVDDYQQYAASLPITYQKTIRVQQGSGVVLLSLPRPYLLQICSNYHIGTLQVELLDRYGYDECGYSFCGPIDKYSTVRLYGFPSPVGGKPQVTFARVFTGTHRTHHVKDYFTYLNPDNSALIRLIKVFETEVGDGPYHLDLAKQAHNMKEDDTRTYSFELPTHIPIATFPDNGRAHHEIAQYVATHKIASYKVENLQRFVITADTPEKVIAGYFESLFDSYFADFCPDSDHAPKFQKNLRQIQNAMRAIEDPQLRRLDQDEALNQRRRALTAEAKLYQQVCDLMLKFRSVFGGSLKYHFTTKLGAWLTNSLAVARLDIVPPHLRPMALPRELQVYIPDLITVFDKLFQLRENFIEACQRFPEDTSVDLSHFATDIKNIMDEFTSIGTKH